MSLQLEYPLILSLILANGVFALAEIAIVSARTGRLRVRAEAGDPGARAALALKDSPDQFLATVQVGITLIGVLTGAFGGTTIAKPAGEWLSRFPGVRPYGEVLALLMVVSAITYLSLVLGELVPKRIALSDPERFASRLARPMQIIARITSPAVALLSGSTSALTRLLGVRREPTPTVTEEELRMMIQLGTDEGVIRAGEQEMVEAVFRLGDLRVGSLGTSRRDVRWLDVDCPQDGIREALRTHPHSRFPVCEGSLDRPMGIVTTRQLLLQSLSGESLDLRQAMEPALFIPETTRAAHLLERFRDSRRQFAIVVDEHGGTHGIATLTDLLEAIVGDLPQGSEAPRANIQTRDDGSWLVEGSTPLDELADRLRVPVAPGPDYVTVGGLVTNQLGHIPSAGEHFDLEGFRFEVVDLDGLRVDKVWISRTGNRPDRH